MRPDLLRQAAEQALRRGLVTKPDLHEVEAALEPFGGLTAEGKKTPWSAVQRVQRRVRRIGLSGEKLDRDIVAAVREVRRDRARKSRG